RTQTFASALDTSIPAQRACTTSITTSPPSIDRSFVAGRAGRRTKSDARARSTNPRFPWKPSATMLTYRLTGTTEDIGVNHDEHLHHRPDHHQAASQTRRRIFTHHGARRR